MKKSYHWPTTRASLLGQLRESGDDQAWRRFVDLYLPLIYGHARYCGLQDADAQNVAQEVLTHVSRLLRAFRYDPQRGRFRNWLGLITRQRIVRLRGKERDSLRGAGGGIGDDLCNLVESDLDGAWTDAFTARVYRCACDEVRGEVDGDTWRVFERVWEQGESPQFVADSLNRKPDWVYRAKYTVLSRVKQVVAQLCDDASAIHRPH
jgi:RNA polymerase sigma-70 factor (ECF subfamily)